MSNVTASTFGSETMTSAFASLLKSPTAKLKGSENVSPVEKFVAAPKLPAPSPRRMETVCDPRLTTAISFLPSLLKSAMATAFGSKPVGWFVIVAAKALLKVEIAARQIRVMSDLFTIGIKQCMEVAQQLWCSGFVELGRSGEHP